jgi:type IV pilus assembly protein PilW
MTHNKGFSLIELMVSVMLGMFLMLGIYGTYSASKKTYSMRNESSELEANARIALKALRYAIEHAGYPSIYNYPIDKPFYSKSDGTLSVPLFARSGNIYYANATWLKNYYTRDLYSDRISIIFMPDNPNDAGASLWRDCGGLYADNNKSEKVSSDPFKSLVPPEKAKVYISFFLANRQLKCNSSRKTRQPIANNLENMQFRYGVKTGTTMIYKTATEVEAANEWGNVISVQVALLMRSNYPVKEHKEVRNYVLLDKRLYRNDKYLRQVYTSTIHLPNMDD